MSDGPREYRYHPAMQWLAIVLLAVPLAALYVPLAVIPAKEFEVRVILAGLCGAFALYFAPLVWEAMMWRMAVGDDGIECRSPWRGTWTIRWDDVKRLEYSPLAMWFIIVTGNGRWFRFSYTVGDRDRLMAEFERRLKPEQFRQAVAGYEFIGRPCPYRQQLPAVLRPTAERKPVPGVDLSKWGDRRR